MSAIKRWDIAALGNGFIGMKQRDDGAFVRNSDHEAEVARLRAEMEKVRGYEVAPLEAKVAELSAEAEWLRSWLLPMQVLVSAVEEEFCSAETEASEPDHSKVSYPEEDCPITFGMIREARKAIDYAMGESA